MTSAISVLLFGCGSQPSADVPRANGDVESSETRTPPDPAAPPAETPSSPEPAPSEAETAPGASLSARPFLAVNTVDALLPLGRTRGRLAVVDGCVTFKVRDQLYTPIWPEGSRLSDDGARISGPAGESFAFGQDVTLDGAAFSLANASIRLREPIPGRCPTATYAVNL